MAFASDSTTAPAVQAGLLPSLDRRTVSLDGWARARETAARLGGAVRAHLADGMRQAWAAARAMIAQPTPSLPVPAPLPSLTTAFTRRRAIFGAVAVDEPDTAAQARAIHLRRQLAQAAEHGVALLASLDLPRLVTPDFVPLNRIAIGDAVEAAVAVLDAMDADSEAEDEPDDESTGDDELSLGWTNAIHQLRLGEASDDGEPTLGAPERHPYVVTMGLTHFEAANGSYWRAQNWMSQASWAQGARLDGEGEADVGYDLGEDSTPDEDGLSRLWIDADRIFGLRVEGDCCAPHILDGGSVHVDKEAEPKADDFVAIFFEGWRDNRYGMHGWVKRLSISLPSGTRWPFYAAPGNELSPVLMVESLNPPIRYRPDVTKVHAVFKVVEIIPPAPPMPRVFWTKGAHP